MIIIYAFRIFGKHEACSGLEPHLHNSADLIRSALAPNDMRLAHSRSGVLSAYRRDLKPQEKISINARHGPVSHLQLRSSFSLKARTHWKISVASPIWCWSRLSYATGSDWRRSRGSVGIGCCMMTPDIQKSHSTVHVFKALSLASTWRPIVSMELNLGKLQITDFRFQLGHRKLLLMDDLSTSGLQKILDVKTRTQGVSKWRHFAPNVYNCHSIAFEDACVLMLRRSFQLSSENYIVFPNHTHCT